MEPGAPVPTFSGGNPTRENYIFSGWTSKSGMVETVQENITFTASWMSDLWEPD